MQWVKLQVSLRHNPAFRGLSDRAKVAYLGALMSVADYDQTDGILRTWRGPISDAELAVDLMVSPRVLRLVLLELERAKLIERLDDGTPKIVKYKEKTESSSAPRVRNHRSRKSLESALQDVTESVTVTVTSDVTVTPDVTQNVTDVTPDVTVTVTPDVTGEIRDKSIDPDPYGAKAPPGSASSGQKPEEAAWAQRLRAEVYALSDRSLRSLTADERVLIARYHCLVFANCTKSEPSNKSRATGVAAAFASMGRNATYGDLTVKQYFLHGRKVSQQRERTPFYDPWLIRAVVEFEQC